MLGEQASHDDFAVLLGSGVVAISTVELFGHPFGQGPFVSLDGRQLFGVPAHVVGQSAGERGGEWLTSIEPFRGEAERCCLEARVTGRHALRIAGAQTCSISGQWETTGTCTVDGGAADASE